MRILYITPFFQHPAIHGPTRHYYFIRELSRSHAITLLTPIRARVPAAALREMADYTQTILTFDMGHPSTTGRSMHRGAWPQLQRRLENLRRSRQATQDMKRAFRRLAQPENFDVVLFHGKSVFPIIADFDRLPVVADVCDATSLRIATTLRYASLTRRPLLMLQYWHIRQLERRLVNKTPYLAFITRRDREAVLRSNGTARIVPNIVDTQYWRRTTNQPEPNCILFSGAMDYAPNVDGALHLINRILPIVRQSLPDIKVLIVGRNPRPEVLAAARPYPDITVTGSVDDMRPYFERAAICAAPLRIASGQQNKLLEAMAMEVPVVTTPVAAAGVCMDGAEAPLAVAEGAHGQAEALVRLLRDPEERARLAAAGRRFVEEHFSWAHSARILEELCLAAVEQHRQRGATSGK